MALQFIVEDGTGLETANSYVSITYADQYAVNFGYSAWDTYSTPVKQQYLIQATQYIDLSFNFNSKITNINSYKTNEEQALEFPRTNFFIGSYEFSSSAIPVNVMKATVEGAVQIGADASRLITSTSGEVLKIEEVVGAVKIERFDNSRSSTETIYPTINRLLKNIGTFGSSNGAIIQVRV